MPAGIDVDLLKRYPARNVELRLMRREIRFQIAVARLARQSIFAEELSLLPNPVTDDGIVPIETQGEAFPIEHLVAHVGVDCRPQLVLVRRSSAVARTELCGDRGDSIGRNHDLGRIGRRRRDEAIGAEDRRSEQRKVQERLPEQPADHGVYQIGDVNARSCVVIGTFGSGILILKYAAS